MKRYLFVILIALLLTGCIGWGSTAEPTWDTVMPPPTETPTATEIPPTTTPEPPPERPELITLNKAACGSFLCTPGPQGWAESDTLWWQVGTDTDTPPEVRHETNPANIMGKEDGVWAAGQMVLNGRQAGSYWLVQEVTDVQPGALYRFSGWMFAYAQDPSNPNCTAGVGQPPCGTITLQIGVDPLGGTDPEAPSIIWSLPHANMPVAPFETNDCLGQVDFYEVNDVYDPYQVNATPRQKHISLFIRADMPFPYPIATVTMAQFEMRALGWEEQFYSPAGNPVPEPTDEPVHTPTPIVQATPLPPDAEGTFKALETLRVRISAEVTENNDTGERVAAGTEGLVYDTHDENGNQWLCVQADTFLAWTDDNQLVEQEDCIGWIAAEYQGQVLAEYELIQ